MHRNISHNKPLLGDNKLLSENVHEYIKDRDSHDAEKSFTSGGSSSNMHSSGHHHHNMGSSSSLPKSVEEIHAAYQKAKEDSKYVHA